MTNKTTIQRIQELDREMHLLTREAIVWLLRLTSGEAVEDADTFKRWRAQSPDHAAAWSGTVRLWRALGPALREWLHEHQPSEQPDSPGK
jgi:transmembrane sensor